MSGGYFDSFFTIQYSVPSSSWDEPKCEELPDGSVILSSRARARRISDRTKVNLALQSVPLGEGRKNVVVWYREIPEEYIAPDALAAGWSGPYQVSEDDSAYSTMILQSDGLVGFFYEEHLNADITGYDMVYAPLSIEVITGGEYR